MSDSVPQNPKLNEHAQKTSGDLLGGEVIPMRDTRENDTQEVVNVKHGLTCKVPSSSGSGGRNSNCLYHILVLLSNTT